jgi:hypothetical protein
LTSRLTDVSLLAGIPRRDMNIKVSLNHALQPYAGNRETIEVMGSTVRECLDNLSESFPVFREILFSAEGFLTALVFLDGETIMPDDLNRPIKSDSLLLLAPMIYGG